MLRRFVVLLISVCGVRHSSGQLSISFETADLSSSSGFDDIRSARTMSGQDSDTREYYFLWKCDGYRTYIADCATTQTDCPHTLSFSTDAGASETVTVFLSNTTPETRIIWNSPNSDVDYQSLYDNLFGQPGTARAHLCRSIDDESVVSFRPIACSCGLSTISIDSPSIEDSVETLIQKISLSPTPKQDPWHRVILMSEYYTPTGIRGCTYPDAYPGVLSELVQFGDTPDCSTREGPSVFVTDYQEINFGQTKACSSEGLYENRHPLKLKPEGKVAQINLYFTIDRQELIVLTKNDKATERRTAKTLDGSVGGGFTTKTILCISTTTAWVTSETRCSCPFSASLDTSTLSSSSSDGNIYTAIKASGDSSGHFVYLIDTTANGCLQTTKTRILAAIQFDTSSCTNEIDLADGKKACEIIAWSAPTSNQKHQITLYYSTIALTSSISSSNRDGPEVASFFPSLSGAPNQRFCYEDGTWSSGSCQCISIDLSSMTFPSSLTEFAGKVLVRGAAYLVLVDTDAASGTDSAGCSVQSSEPAGKVLAHITNIGVGAPSTACGDDETIVTFKENYKGCGAVAYTTPTVPAGEIAHQLTVYAYSGSLANAPSTRLDAGNALAADIEALNEEKITICIREGSTPTTGLPWLSPNNADCSCRRTTVSISEKTTLTRDTVKADFYAKIVVSGAERMTLHLIDPKGGQGCGLSSDIPYIYMRLTVLTNGEVTCSSGQKVALASSMFACEVLAYETPSFRVPGNHQLELYLSQPNITDADISSGRSGDMANTLYNRLKSESSTSSATNLKETLCYNSELSNVQTSCNCDAPPTLPALTIADLSTLDKSSTASPKGAYYAKIRVENVINGAIYIFDPYGGAGCHASSKAPKLLSKLSKITIGSVPSCSDNEQVVSLADVDQTFTRACESITFEHPSFSSGDTEIVIYLSTDLSLIDSATADTRTSDEVASLYRDLEAKSTSPSVERTEFCFAASSDKAQVECDCVAPASANSDDDDTDETTSSASLSIRDSIPKSINLCMLALISLVLTAGISSIV